jgi:hypothetical protein
LICEPQFFSVKKEQRFDIIVEEQWFCEPSKPLFLTPSASGKNTEDSENGFFQYSLKTSAAIGFFIGLLVNPFWQNCTQFYVQRYSTTLANVYPQSNHHLPLKQRTLPFCLSDSN